MTMASPVIRDLYSTTFSQATSPNGSLLAVGNNEGKIALFELGPGRMPKLGPASLPSLSGVAANQESGIGERLKSPCKLISAHNDAVYAMVATDAFCISGTTGLIAGRRWSEMRESQPAAWTISLECDQANFGMPEVNSLSYDGSRGLVYAACGDWRTHVYDLETGKRTQTLEGHDDYVHDVVSSGDLVASAGEDGQVLVWDPRAGREPRHRLSPYTHTQLARPYLGRFVASLDLYNDWLVCGGGPKAGVFHLRSLALTTVLPPPKPAIHVTKFTRHAEGGDRGGIVVAGVTPHLYVCSMAGMVTAQLPSSSPCIYTVNVSEKPFTMMTYGGTSTKIDVCFNLNYRDHTVSLLDE